MRSLGFRGEALAAIVAAAEVDCTTRVAGESAAATARYRGGRPATQGSASGAPGTSIEVRELFAALPARRAFLRSPRAEARAVARVLEDYALAYPAVAFRLELDGRAALASPGDGEARSAWAAVYDADSAGALLALDHREPVEGRRAGGERAGRAAVAAPRQPRRAAPRGERTGDRRPRAHVRGRARLRGAAAGRAGTRSGLLRIELPPELIDVNVHPTKAEVRFREERAVARAVGAALRAALAGAPAPAGPPPIAGSTSAPWIAPGLPEASAPPSAAALLRSARPAEPREEPVERPELPLAERLPALRPLGQIDETFLVAEAPDGLCLVDQHAAHERVLYERVRAQLAAGDAASQPLLQAVVAPLSASQAALAAAEAEPLAALGWVLEATDDAALIVRALPALLGDGDPGAALAQLLDRMEAEERLSGPDPHGGEPRLPGGRSARATASARRSSASCWPPSSAARSRRPARTAARRCCTSAASSCAAPSGAPEASDPLTEQQLPGPIECGLRRREARVRTRGRLAARGGRGGGVQPAAGGVAGRRSRRRRRRATRAARAARSAPVRPRRGRRRRRRRAGQRAATALRPLHNPRCRRRAVGAAAASRRSRRARARARSHGPAVSAAARRGSRTRPRRDPPRQAGRALRRQPAAGPRGLRRRRRRGRTTTSAPAAAAASSSSRAPGRSRKTALTVTGGGISASTAVSAS